MEKQICILSGRYPVSDFESYINHKVYAERHGYTYINCIWPNKVDNPYMNKLLYIKEYYNFFDYIFWIDDDAFFMNFEKGLEDFIPVHEQFLTICSSPDFKELRTYFSSGQFMLKCDKIGRKFIDETLSTDLKLVKNWWSKDLGFFSGGDQDKMIYQCLTNDMFKGNYSVLNYKRFNSRVENYFGVDTHKLFILHFTGLHKIKQQNYLKIQKRLMVGPSLLREDELVGWGIRRKSGNKTKIVNRFKRIGKRIITLFK